jgi:hypothetical protein
MLDIIQNLTFLNSSNIVQILWLDLENSDYHPFPVLKEHLGGYGFKGDNA